MNNIKNSLKLKVAIFVAALSLSALSLADTTGGTGGTDWGTTFTDAATSFKGDVLTNLQGVMPILLSLLGVVLVPLIIRSMIKRFAK